MHLRCLALLRTGRHSVLPSGWTMRHEWVFVHMLAGRAVDLWQSGNRGVWWCLKNMWWNRFGAFRAPRSGGGSASGAHAARQLRRFCRKS